MSLSEADLQELYRRAQLAQNSGYTIARGEDYAALLGGSDGSPAGLIALCEAALPTPSNEPPSGEGDEPTDEPSTLPPTPATEVTEDADEQAEPEAAPPEAPVETPVEVAEAPVEAPVETPEEAPADSTPVEGAPAIDAPLEQILDEVAAEETPSDSPEYEGWSRKQLVAEAETKGVDVKSSMSKSDIIAALRAAAAG